MNIESVLSKIKLFDELVVKSGFKRDIQDFIQAIQQSQNQNLVFMKGLSTKVEAYFQQIENNSLDSELEIILKENEPFTTLTTLEELDQLNSDTDIQSPQYFQKFNQILNNLKQEIEKNHKELNSVEKVFSKYVSSKELYQSEEEQALISLVFKDLEATKSLKNFSKVLSIWNRTLLLYHTLLTSKSPEEISLVEIQNGSIDVIFNIDIDIAIDLADLIKIGLKVYGVYLLYKSKRAREIIDSYMGHKKLIEMEEEREVLMLDNIKDSVKKRVIEQHKERLEEDKNIDKTGASKKAEIVSKVIADHLIKGNEIKLLTAPKVEENDDEQDISKELREETAIVRERFKQLGKEDKLLLLEKYGLKDEIKDI